MFSRIRDKYSTKEKIFSVSFVTIIILIPICTIHFNNYIHDQWQRSSVILVFIFCPNIATPCTNISNIVEYTEEEKGEIFGMNRSSNKEETKLQKWIEYSVTIYQEKSTILAYYLNWNSPQSCTSINITVIFPMSFQNKKIEICDEKYSNNEIFIQPTLPIIHAHLNLTVECRDNNNPCNGINITINEPKYKLYMWNDSIGPSSSKIYSGMQIRWDHKVNWTRFSLTIESENRGTRTFESTIYENETKYIHCTFN